MGHLNSSSAEHLSYHNGLLNIDILGGVKLEGLDRLRVTLKLCLPESSVPPVRHNLDLYNDTQTEKLIRKTAERLEIGTTVVTASLAELTEALERYRLKKIEEQQTDLPQPMPLSEAERDTAIAHLQHADLMEQTLKDLKATGIQGEPENSLILKLAMTSRKMHDPLSVVCLAKSGTGKSYLMERVALCIPDEDKREQTQFSGNSFYYFKREEIRGKIFLIEDLDGAQEVMFPIRELQTKKRISKTVAHKGRDGKLQTITLVVEGPVSIIGCTTKEQLYEDNANRAILIYLDSSKEQDERIMSYQKQLRAGLIDTGREQDIRTKLQHMEKALQPVKVINPYAPLIDLPQEVFKPRRTLPMLLSFIEAITFYHQYQRTYKPEPSTGEVYIETNPEDIAWAFELLRETMFRKSDELPGALRTFYEWLKPWAADKGLDKFYGAEIRKENRLHPRTLQRYLSELTEYGYIKHLGGSKYKSGYQYSIEPEQSEAQLSASITRQIEAVLDNIHKAQQERETLNTKEPKKATVRQRATKTQLSHPHPLQETPLTESDTTAGNQEP
ncbi:MAG TPA: hypothetical protein VL098_08500 [Flavipsychrobacter sp.]|nr:hypothetical protein [Flavipsychrobacter sp.]